jgi:hypothetical protein
MPVLVFVIVTVAPGTIAPAASVTVPFTVAVVVWAKRPGAAITTASTPSNHRRFNLNMYVLRENKQTVAINDRELLGSYLEQVVSSLNGVESYATCVPN